MSAPRTYGRWRGFTDIVAALLGNPGGAFKLDAAFGALSAGATTLGATAAGALTTLGSVVPATKRGANLGDADATIAPGTDGASQYVLPAGTLTANRVITLADTAALTFQALEIVRLDSSAFTLTIKNAAAATLVVLPASVRCAPLFTFISGASHWAFGQLRMLA